MKTRFGMMVIAMISILAVIGCDKKEEGEEMAMPLEDLGPSTIVTWETTDFTESNNDYSVWVRGRDEDWQPLQVYTVMNGEQKENDVPTRAGMINFDFTGTVELKVTYHKEIINDYQIRPTNYSIQAVKDDDHTLRFKLTQDDNYPIKPTLMINGDWSEGNLHIITNFPEQNPISKDADHVLLIKPGDPIPHVLPPNKDTLYFDAGLHELPKGMWVELDLLEPYSLERFELIYPATGSQWFAKGPQRFTIEAKMRAEDPYELIFDGTENTNEGFISDNIHAQARYIKLNLLGNSGDSNYVMSSLISEFRLYGEGDEHTNIAYGKAIAGSIASFPNVTDDNEYTHYISSTGYANWHAGESYYVHQSGVTLYFAPGSVVKGSIAADGVDGITIRGRGILYGGELLRPRNYAEGRSGAIWIANSNHSVVKGITLLDYPMWAVVMNFNENPTVRNINFFGSMVNADGIHFSGSKNGLVSGAFIRTTDDNFVIYHYGEAENIRVENSVFWADNARPVLLGMGNNYNAPIRNVVFDNIFILNQRGVWDLNKYNGAIQIWANGNNQIHDITFRNVHIDEFEAPRDSMLFQIKTVEISPGDGHGIVRNIVFDNVVYQGEHPRKSYIYGADPEHAVTDVQFKGFRINDQLLTEDNAEEYIDFLGVSKNMNYTE